jgi:hypothetical protein
MMQDTQSSPISNEKGAKNNYAQIKLLIIIYIQSRILQKTNLIFRILMFLPPFFNTFAIFCCNVG